ncbi:MAG: VTT domain-containing protein [Acidobacteriota bacterium]|jgi:membrane protein YqaA with SNARE-associated domain|nr:VTT domain-containing protein [Acidobacteriota bacterium]
MLHPLSKTLNRVSEVLITFGPFGLFVVALLDSSFVPLPSSADALMLLLTTAHPRWMLLYAAVATAGSATGCLILYYASRRAGKRALARFSEKKQKRVKDWIDRYDVISVLVASLLPPPFPFKLFVVSAGVFHFSVTRFLIAIVVGRGFRFLLEGYFAIRYGARAKAVLAEYYPWIGLGLAVLIVAGFLTRALLKRRSRTGADVEEGLEARN